LAGKEARPDSELNLLDKPPPPMGWAARWVRWPDWWLPADQDETQDALLEQWRRAEIERVEVASTGAAAAPGRRWRAWR